MLLWVKAFHIIFMVTWFSALFYLPRLFVYHALSTDAIGNDRFKMMERKLYYRIATPGAVLTTLLGFWLLKTNFVGYMHMGWMHAKLGLVLLLWIYHLYCGKFLNAFKADKNRHGHIFYRFFNEIPVVILVGIVILVIVKPS